MVDTRSKGAPIAKKLSNGCPAKWSPSKRADMLQILKQEKVNDNTKFSLSKNSKVWQKVSKELIDDDEQKTPKRCCFHFMNMKREAGYIEHALKLEGVTWNKKTSMLEPVEGALDGVEKKHAKYAYTPYKYYEDTMKIIGKKPLKGAKKEEPMDESEEEEEAEDENTVAGDAKAKEEPEEKKKVDNKKPSAKEPEGTRAEDDEDDQDAEERSEEESQQDTPSPKNKAPKKAGKGKTTETKKQTAVSEATTKVKTDKPLSTKNDDDDKSVAESKTSKQNRKPAALKHSKKMDAAIAERVKDGKVPAITQAKFPNTQGKGLEMVAEDDEDFDMENAYVAATTSDEEKAGQSAKENDSGTESAAADAVRNEEGRKANEVQRIATPKKWAEGVAAGYERKQGQKRTSSSTAPVWPNSKRPRKQSRQASVSFGFRVTKSVNGGGKAKKDLKAESTCGSTQSRATSVILESIEKEGTPYISVCGASEAHSLKSNSHEDVKQQFAELEFAPQEKAMREVQMDGMLTVEGKLAMTDLFDDDAKAARMYLRVVDNIEMCKPWLEKKLRKIREDDWEDYMLWGRHEARDAETREKDKERAWLIQATLSGRDRRKRGIEDGYIC